MNDALYEQLVARKSSPKDNMIRIGIIVFTASVLIIATSLIGFLGVMLAVILAFLDYYFIFPKLNVEYEYTLLNHDLQIDTIYNQAKRKKQISFDIQHAEIIAPNDSRHLNSKRADKTLDFSSHRSTAKKYSIFIPLEQKNMCIIIEPDDKMLTHMKSWMGSKFFID